MPVNVNAGKIMKIRGPAVYDADRTTPQLFLELADDSRNDKSFAALEKIENLLQ